MGSLFITGGTGFIGSAVVRRAIAAGRDVEVLTRSEASAERARQAGAAPVIGDLAVPGRWQEAAAAAEAIIHLAQPETYGTRVSTKRAQAYRDNRLLMDRLLLDGLDPSRTKQIIYVAGTSYIGDQGTELRDERTPPNPKGWGPYIEPALERLPEYAQRGLPIVQAFPGWVYGPGSWFAEYTLDPLRANKHIFRLTGGARLASPVHVEDVARALLHLLEAGQPGERYFIVDDQPGFSHRLPEVAAVALGARLRWRTIPVWLCSLYLGPIVTESLTCNTRLSNAKLKACGFSLDYPSIDEGIPNVVSAWLERQPAATSSSTLRSPSSR